MNEREIIEQLKQGDHRALKEIIDIHQNYVYTIALQMVKKKEAAEEIVQDVFVKVYQKVNTYEYKSKFSTWLYTIVYRTTLNYLQKKHFLISASDFAGSENESADNASINITAGFETIHNDSDSISEPEYERQLIIYSAIDKLEMKQGVIIALFYLKEFSVREIAEIMELSVNTIKTHLFRGRENLKKMLLKEYSPEDLL